LKQMWLVDAAAGFDAVHGSHVAQTVHGVDGVVGNGLAVHFVGLDDPR
jgi:Na+-transporting NADH:ubiquinone oxidoreductase subunit NqrC